MSPLRSNDTHDWQEANPRQQQQQQQASQNVNSTSTVKRPAEHEAADDSNAPPKKPPLVRRARAYTHPSYQGNIGNDAGASETAW